LVPFRETISISPPQHTSSISQPLSTSVWTAGDAVSSKLGFQLLDQLDNIYYFLYREKNAPNFRILFSMHSIQKLSGEISRLYNMVIQAAAYYFGYQVEM
jgi:hypothetical protein